MNYETIRYRVEDHVGVIQLHRPERMNAVVEEMYLELRDVLKNAETDGTVRSLILTGSVLKKDGKEKQAFCAGADLKKHAAGERTHGEKRDYILLAHETTGMVYHFPKPILAAINGPARGAGAEMALNCDFIFMAHEATIAFPEAGLGTFVGGGVTFLLPRILGLAAAKELIYTGRPIDGKAAVSLGLALRSCPVEDLLQEATLFARLLAEKAPLSMRFAKKWLQESHRMDIDTMLLLEADAILQCMDTEDWHEGVRAFAEKRKPIYRGR